MQQIPFEEFILLLNKRLSASGVPVVSYERDDRGEAVWSILAAHSFEAAVLGEVRLIEQELAIQRVQVDATWPDTDAITPLFVIRGMSPA